MQARNVRELKLKLAIMLLGDGWSEKDRVGYFKRYCTSPVFWCPYKDFSWKISKNNLW
jgi:hypothetical protein